MKTEDRSQESGVGMRQARQGFTLLELLVVIAIIGIVSAIALPVLKSFKPDPLKVASIQLVNDLSYARRRAIADHTTVYVVFMPPVALLDPSVSANLGKLTPNEQQWMLKNQFNGYGMYEKRTVGDQPGASTPHWLGRWRTLPDGTAISQQMFGWTGVETGPQPMANVGFGYWSFDYFSAGQIIINPDTNQNLYVSSTFPALAFDYRGSLIQPQGRGWIPGNPPPNGYVGKTTGDAFDYVIPLTKAHTALPATGWQTASFKEDPAGASTNIYSHVVIDGPTGRSRLDRKQVQ